ncbi:MAG: adenosylmethionine decarboxylase [Methylococcaceae bacterium]|nr:adenosylmethionine decarboxylase [Methylococcaceae bacterium]
MTDFIKYTKKQSTGLEPPLGEFIERNGVEYAGIHLLIDCWGASQLDNIKYMEDVLCRCVSASFATLLHLHCHQFSQSGGLSAVAVLAESHISVHTWPEKGFAAFDVFMCGAAQPMNIVDVLKQAFQPTELKIKEVLRGYSSNE